MTTLSTVSSDRHFTATLKTEITRICPVVFFCFQILLLYIFFCSFRKLFFFCLFVYWTPLSNFSSSSESFKLPCPALYMLFKAQCFFSFFTIKFWTFSVCRIKACCTQTASILPRCSIFPSPQSPLKVTECWDAFLEGTLNFVIPLSLFIC